MAKKSKKEEEIALENDSKQEEIKNDTTSENKSEKKNEKKTKKEKNKTPKVKKKKSILKSFIRWIIFLLIVAGISAFAIYSLPINPEIQSKKLESNTGKIEDEIEISCNQYVKKVYYSVNPTKKDDLAYYEEVKSVKNGFNTNGFKAKINLEEIDLMPGKGNIYFIVQGLFTKSEPISIKYSFDIGYVAEIDKNQLNEIEDTGIYVSKNRLIVSFKDNISEKRAQELIEKYDGEIVGCIYMLNEYQVEFDGDINEIKNELLEENAIKLVTNDYTIAQVEATSTDIAVEPNDLEKTSQYGDEWNVDNPAGRNWHLELMDVPGAWEVINNEVEDFKSIKVGIIDSSIDYNHEDLNINKDHTFVGASKYYKDVEKQLEEVLDTDSMKYTSTAYHGTHVAGIIGAISNNKKGAIGVNSYADLYFVSYWNIDETEDLSLQRMKYNWCLLISSGVRVINQSYILNIPAIQDEYIEYDVREMSIPEVVQKQMDAEEEMQKSLDSLTEKLENAGYDFLICQAAGNETNSPTIVGNEGLRLMVNTEKLKDHVVIVGNVQNTIAAIDGNETMYMLPNDFVNIRFNSKTERLYNLAESSNYGELIDVCAPGTNIWSTYPMNFKDEDGNVMSYASISGTSMSTPAVTGVASLIYGVNPDLTYKDVKNILKTSYTKRAVKVDDGNYIYPILNAKIAVQKALDYDGETSKPKAIKEGFLNGYVQDSVSEDFIKDVTVIAVNKENEKEYAINTNISGEYSMILPIGTYDISFLNGEYITEQIFNVKVEEGVTTYNILLRMVENDEEKGTVKGKITDAIEAMVNISNAKLEFRRGVDNKDGTIVKEATTDANGQYTIELEPGNYTVTASAEGYLTESFTIQAIGNKTNEEQDGTLTPILKEGEIRAILTWNSNPTDVDSHITGPKIGEEGRFHVYYWNKTYTEIGAEPGNPAVRLDRDDTNSYGPETISVYRATEGVYNYTIYDYTNRNATNSSALAYSGAQVKLYVAGDDEVHIFNVPNSKGNCWKVFSIDKDGNITVINEMTTTSDYANID